MVSTKEKAALSSAYLAITIGVIYTHLTNQLYPGLPLGSGIAILVLLFLTLTNKHPSYVILASGITIGIIYRLCAFLFPSSMIGFDPDAYAVQSLIIVLTGSTNQLVGQFYSIANAYSIYGAIVTLISNLQVSFAYAAVPLAASILIPISAAAITCQITKNRQLTILAALLTILAPTTIKYSINPIPIFFSSLLFMTIVVLTITFDKRNNSYLIAFLVISIVMVFTHKISVFLIVAAVSGFAIVEKSHLVNLKRQYDVGMTLLLISVGILAIQWLYITPYVVDVVTRVLGAFGIGVEITDVPRTAAIPFNPPIEYSIVALGFLLPTLTIGGVIWVYLLYHENSPVLFRLMSIVGITIGFSLPGQFLSFLGGLQRTFFFASASIASLISIGLQTVEKKEGKLIYQIIVCAVVLIIISQSFSSAMTPDYRKSPREYLTAGEVEGKKFAHNHIKGTVQMDTYYWDEVINFKRAAKDASPKYQHTVPNNRIDGILARELTNGTLQDKNYHQVLLRTNVNVYRMDNGRWILTWNPVQTMKSDPYYHQSYSNGDVILFTNTNSSAVG